MNKEKFNDLVSWYNNEIISHELAGRVKLHLDAYDETYAMLSLFIDDKTYKFFSYEEIVGYDYSRFIYDVMISLQSRYEMALSIPISKREVYSGLELLAALKNYFNASYPYNIDLDNPLCCMLYILDKRTNISEIDDRKINHNWLVDIYNLRLTGAMPKEFYERKTVVLDFASCDGFGDMYREMRIKMRWFLYYGESLDALWDILTGMYYYGDDFLIRRKRIHTYTEYGRIIDFTDKVNKFCKLFQEAAMDKYSDITVKIEYID